MQTVGVKRMDIYYSPHGSCYHTDYYKYSHYHYYPCSHNNHDTYNDYETCTYLSRLAFHISILGGSKRPIISVSSDCMVTAVSGK